MPLKLSPNYRFAQGKPWNDTVQVALANSKVDLDRLEVEGHVVRRRQPRKMPDGSLSSFESTQLRHFGTITVVWVCRNCGLCFAKPQITARFFVA